MSSSSAVFRCVGQALEHRCLPASISWDGGGDGTSWSDSSNWASDRVPTSQDDVYIGAAVGQAVVIHSGAEARNLTALRRISIPTGSYTTLAIYGDATIQELASVGTLYAGPGANVTIATGTSTNNTIWQGGNVIFGDVTCAEIAGYDSSSRFSGVVRMPSNSTNAGKLSGELTWGGGSISPLVGASTADVLCDAIMHWESGTIDEGVKVYLTRGAFSFLECRGLGSRQLAGLISIVFGTLAIEDATLELGSSSGATGIIAIGGEGTGSQQPALVLRSGARITANNGGAGSMITAAANARLVKEGSGIASIETGVVLSNSSGAVVARAGTLQVSTCAQVAAGTLSPSKWQFEEGRLELGESILISRATITYAGTSGEFASLAGIADNQGGIYLSPNANATLIAASGGFTNSGSIDVLGSARLSIVGDMIQASTGRLSIPEQSVLPSGVFGRMDVSGSLSLSGLLIANLRSPISVDAQATLIRASSITGMAQFSSSNTYPNTQRTPALKQVGGDLLLTVLPYLPGVLLDAGSDTGVSNVDGITSDSDPIVKILGWDGGHATVSLGGIPIFSGAIEPNVPQFIQAPHLSDGTYPVYVELTDAQGDVSVGFRSNVVVDTVPIRLLATQFDANARSLRLTFDSSPRGVAVSDLVVTDAQSGAIYAPTSVSAPTTSSVASWTYSVAALPPQGIYNVTINAGALSDVAGNGCAQITTEFFVLPGDANRDGAVNFADLLVVAQNYGKPVRTFSQGDFNYDTVVNFSDLLILAQRYGSSLYSSPSLSPSALVPRPVFAGPQRETQTNRRTAEDVLDS